MNTKWEAIKRWRNNTIHVMAEERRRYGSYEAWYQQLGSFRKAIINNYIKVKSPWGTYRHRNSINSYGDIIDHHIMSYLAPMYFKRISWGGRKCSPSNHVIALANYFKDKGIRFLYVPLPNKGVIYPSVLELGDYGKHPLNSPQWRKYVLEIAKAGVEVLDATPVFLAHRQDKDSLYSRDHHISSYGGSIVAKLINEYIQETTMIPNVGFKLYRNKIEKGKDDYYFQRLYGRNEKLYMINTNLVAGSKINGMIPYERREAESLIGLFGDCNVQKYEEYGAGIHAQLSEKLRYPIHNMGRQLIFSESEDALGDKVLKEMCTKKMVIYIAFASAGFVRSSHLSFHRAGRPYKWNHLELE